MNIFDKLAESQIEAAIERGELRDLPGEGKPLALDDTSMIPEALRAVYRLLKNAGYLPPEVQLRRDIATAEQLLLQTEDAACAEYAKARARLEILRLRLHIHGGSSGHLQLEDEYYRKLLDRMERNDLP